jgi:dolichol-phosphate mannosyltransferase
VASSPAAEHGEARAATQWIAREARRARDGLDRRENWVQLAKFCVVGASGYVVNLACYTALLLGAGFHYIAASACAFIVAVTNNYLWNRLWTFRRARASIALQGFRFFVVSGLAYAVNVALLAAFVSLGMHKVAAQALAIVLVTPVSFAGNKIWSFRAAGAQSPREPIPSRQRP